MYLIKLQEHCYLWDSFQEADSSGQEYSKSEDQQEWMESDSHPAQLLSHLMHAASASFQDCLLPAEIQSITSDN